MFKLKSQFKPAGDQPKAIAQLEKGLKNGDRAQTLLGVTGSGKTFTIANIIAQGKRPALVIAHNKTLAAQLCQEFREFFPDAAVHYFVSYYDYYQPEAYMPASDTYIDKEATINEEIDRLRHAATSALLSRKDVIIVASVSCIYGLGAPKAYEATALHFKAGERFERDEVIKRFIDMQFTRTNDALKRGTFRLRGDVLEVMPIDEEIIYRLDVEDGLVSEIVVHDALTRGIKSQEQDLWIFPAKHFITMGKERERALCEIERELRERLKFFEKSGKLLEAERLSRRTRQDMEMLRELGFCHGIENYSRHLTGRVAGEAPYTLLDYFPRNGDGEPDFLTIIDESHVTIPQIGGMFEGDASRKRTLIEYGFRLPSARDNRPLKFDEFLGKVGQMIYTSATPGVYERENSDQIIEQIIRPTGLLDPKILIRPISEKKSRLSLDKFNRSRLSLDSGVGKGQVEDFVERAKERVGRGERVLATTLTKKMAEDLFDYLSENGFKANYLHSDIKALERVRILTDFRRGKFDVLVGVNLLREGLDLPEVTLIGILDADKEGFLRSETSLVQTIGRAARNVRGEVVLYADEITGSMRRAIDETERRRELQLAYNKKYGIIPQTIKKGIGSIVGDDVFASEAKQSRGSVSKHAGLPRQPDDYIGLPRNDKELIKQKEAQMKEAAGRLDFEGAMVLREEIKELKKAL